MMQPICTWKVPGGRGEVTSDEVLFGFVFTEKMFPFGLIDHIILTVNMLVKTVEPSKYHEFAFETSVS